MYVVLLSLLVAVYSVFSTESYDSGDHDKRALSAFDTLGGIGLGKRSHLSSMDSLAGLGLGKRALSSFDTLGGIGLGKRLSSFDTLGGIGLGKRSDLFKGEKKSLSSFDTLAGIGLGKRGTLFPTVNQPTSLIAEVLRGLNLLPKALKPMLSSVELEPDQNPLLSPDDFKSDLLAVLLSGIGRNVTAI
ncbi:unnamed protein product [Heligmosomoides polygyrus]|uniref:Orcokinin n=1 Tax=Heligmosomoides polygyrus TaxID=6339 RepID=A0A183F1V1_HELPZ|nr:unnamed protein product [Heligmosomoides polygyrus]